LFKSGRVRASATGRAFTVTSIARASQPLHHFTHCIARFLLSRIEFCDLLVGDLQRLPEIVASQCCSEPAAELQLQSNLVQSLILRFVQKSGEHFVILLCGRLAVLLHLFDDLATFFFRHILKSVAIRPTCGSLLFPERLNGGINQGRLPLFDLQLIANLLERQQARTVISYTAAKSASATAKPTESSLESTAGPALGLPPLAWILLRFCYRSESDNSHKNGGQWT